MHAEQIQTIFGFVFRWIAIEFDTLLECVIAGDYWNNVYYYALNDKSHAQ